MQEPTFLQTAQTGGVRIVKQGYGEKRGGLRSTGYKKRWFVLTELGQLMYFENNDSTAPLGCVYLLEAALVAHKEHDYKLIIRTKTRDWGLKFETKESRESWEADLRGVIARLRENSHPNVVKLLKLDADKHLKQLAAAELGQRLNDISVTCFTWNLGEKLPDFRELRFLKQFVGSDLIVFGLQEFQPASSSLITHQADKNQRPSLDIWNAMLQSVLGIGYAFIASKSMGGMAISCFAHERISDYVTVISTGSVPCGIGNVLYNKGAVALSLSIDGTRFAFVSAHLPAHHNKVHERNMAFKRIRELMPQALSDGAKMTEYFDNGESSTFEDGPSSLISAETPVSSIGRPVSDKKRTTVLGDGYSKLSMRLKKKPALTAFDASDFFNQVTFDRNSQDFDEDESEPISDTPALQLPADADVKSNECASNNKNEEEGLVHDRYFFFGDLNYRLDAGKVWVESLIEMAKLKAPRECKISSVGNDVTIGPAAPTTALSELDATSDDLELVKDDFGSNKIDIDTEGDRNSLSPVINLDDAEIEHLRACGMAKWRMNSIDNRSWDEGLLPARAIRDSVELDKDDSGAADGVVGSTGGKSIRAAASVIDNYPKEGMGRNIDPTIDTAGTAAVKDEWEKWKRDHAAEVHSDIPFRLKFFEEQTGLRTSTDIYEVLLLYDQLKNEMKNGNVFHEFLEGPIDFQPTYKYDSYTRRYDTGKKARAPAWCDRILFSSSPTALIATDVKHNSVRSELEQPRKRRTVTGLTIVNSVDRHDERVRSYGSLTQFEKNGEGPLLETDGISLLKYNYINGLFYSDHKPVFAQFIVKLVVLNTKG